MNNATYLPGGLPAPQPESDGLDAPFWEGTSRGVLRVQRCQHCGTWQWGPEWICHHCRSFDIGWEEVAKTGRVYSWARSWHPVHPALSNREPYVFVLVELAHAGKIRMLGNLVGDPMRLVAIGEPVEAVLESHQWGDSNYSLVQWRRTAG